MTRLLLVPIILVAALWLAGCGGIGPTVPESPTAAIGVIDATDSSTDNSIAVDAIAILGGVRGTITVSEGSVVLRGVPFGTGTPPTQPLTVTAPGYRTFADTIQISITEATFYTAVLDPVDTSETGTVTGAVLSTAGTPLVSALVKFVHVAPSGTTEVRGYTDKDGKYIIGGIPIGLNAVTVEAADFITAADQMTVAQDAGGGQNPDLDFSLLPGATRIQVTGIAVDAFTNAAIVGATVEFGTLTPQVTGAGGAFVFSDVPVGTQTIKVTATGYDVYEQDINVLPGMAPLRLGMTPAAPEPPGGPYNLQGKVTISNAADNSGATVTATNTTTLAIVATVTTPASGEYTMFLAPGEYRITASYGTKTPVPRTVMVPGGGRIVYGIDFLF
jgi:hypothetical protein